jgi:hypothetical protein
MRVSLTSLVVVCIAVPFVAGCSQMDQSTSPARTFISALRALTARMCSFCSDLGFQRAVVARTACWPLARLRPPLTPLFPGSLMT